MVEEPDRYKYRYAGIIQEFRKVQFATYVESDYVYVMF
jgi:hypothetical protein